MISLVFLLFFLAAVAAEVLWNFRIHYKKTALYSQISRLFFRKTKKIYDTVRDFDNISFLWFSTGKIDTGKRTFAFLANNADGAVTQLTSRTEE